MTLVASSVFGRQISCDTWYVDSLWLWHSAQDMRSMIVNAIIKLIIIIAKFVFELPDRIECGVAS